MNHHQPFWEAPLESRQKAWRRWIVDWSFQHHLSHLGSCLSAVDAIGAIFQAKKPKEKFVLSNGHTGLALYCLLREMGKLTDEQIGRFNIHPDRLESCGLDVSTGSLGQGWPIALGLALAKPRSHVYVMISDGEAAEGSIWETARLIVDWNVTNLVTIINTNGYGAYDCVPTAALLRRFAGFGLSLLEVNGHDMNELNQAIAEARQSASPKLIVAHTTVEQLPCLRGQDAHYHILTEEEHTQAMEILK
jgi:transketolase